MSELSRRDFLEAAVKAGGVVGGSAIAGKSEAIRKILETLSADEDRMKQEAIDEVAVDAALEKENQLADVIDITTASLIVARFLHKVVWHGSLKQIVLDAYPGSSKLIGTDTSAISFGSALEMNAMAYARTLLLSSFESKKELAHHELDEILSSVKLVPVLVLLSDFTTTSLKVNDKLIFENQDALAAAVSEAGAEESTPMKKDEKAALRIGRHLLKKHPKFLFDMVGLVTQQTAEAAVSPGQESQTPEAQAAGWDALLAAHPAAADQLHQLEASQPGVTTDLKRVIQEYPLIAQPLLDFIEQHPEVITELLTIITETSDEAQSIDEFTWQEIGVDDPIELWESLLEQTNQSIITTKSKISGLTSALAPLGTTYASAAVSNQLKQDMVPLLHKQSVARLMIEEKRAGRVPNEAQVGQQAVERVQHLMDNLTKQLIVTDANAKGMTGAGDPPQIYFFMNHGDNPGLLLAEEVWGLGLSHSLTLATDMAWLAQSGALSAADVPGYTKQFFTAELASVKAIGETIGGLADSDKRTATTGLGTPDKLAATLAEILAEGPGTADDRVQLQLRKLQTALSSAPKVKINLSVARYCKDKARLAEHILHKGIDPIAEQVRKLSLIMNLQSEPDMDESMVSMADMLTGALDPSADSDQQHAASAYFERKIAQVMEIINMQKADPSAVDLLGDQMADLYREAVAANQAEPDGPVVEMSPARQAEVVDQIWALKTQMSELLASGIETAMNTTEEVKADAGVESNENLPDGKITEDPFLEDVARRSARSFVVGAQAADSKDLEHIPHLMSPDAHEVLVALANQLPVVPAAIRMADRLTRVVIEHFGPKESDNKRFTESMITVSMTFLLEAIKSGVADNVAAYLFGENGLLPYFKKQYGEDVFDKHPGLFNDIVIFALKIAELAGSLTKVGNGPNFSHKKVVVRPGATYKDVSVTTTDLSMAETLKNPYAVGANFLLWAGAVAKIAVRLCSVEAQAAA